MGKRHLDQPQTLEVPRELEPWQRIACAVLGLAIEDVSYQSASESRRRQAAAWLLHGDGMRFWCAAIGLDPESVRRRIRQWVTDGVRDHARRRVRNGHRNAR